MEYRGLLFTLSVLSLLHFNQSKRPLAPVAIELKNLTCTTIDTLLLNEFTCIIHKYRPKPIITVRFNIKEIIKAFNIMLNMDIIKKDGAKMNIASVKLDGCKLLSSLHINNFYSRFLKRIQNVSSLPKKCPVQANKLYDLTNFALNGDMYPPGILDFSLIYQLHAKFLRADQLAGSLYAEGTVTY